MVTNTRYFVYDGSNAWQGMRRIMAGFSSLSRNVWFVLPMDAFPNAVEMDDFVILE